METKMIEQVRENVKEYDGRNGHIHVHMVKVEGDPEEWEYHSLTPECKKFTPKEEATFTTDVRVNGQYTNRKISPVTDMAKPKKFGGGGKSKSSDFRDPAVLMYNEVLKAVMQGLSGSSLVLDKAKVDEYIEHYYSKAKEKKGDDV